MKLSAPLYQLKRKARHLARHDNIPLHEALNRLAAQEGFPAWSLLATKASGALTPHKIFAQLRPRDCLLLGARPRQGKTLMSLQLAVEAMKSGSRSVWFTL